MKKFKTVVLELRENDYYNKLITAKTLIVLVNISSSPIRRIVGWDCRTRRSAEAIRSSVGSGSRLGIPKISFRCCGMASQNFLLTCGGRMACA